MTTQATTMRAIRVTFDDGQTLETDINGTDDEIRAYYIGQPFEYDEDEPCHIATAVEFLDTVPTSEARQMLARLPQFDPAIGQWPFIGAIAAPSTVSHQNYSVSYYADHSILIWSRNDGYLVLDGDQTYYRDTVDHLARCMGLFDKSRRADMVGPSDRWIDGIHWSAAGEFIGM